MRKAIPEKPLIYKDTHTMIQQELIPFDAYINAMYIHYTIRTYYIIMFQIYDIAKVHIL